MRRRNMNAVMAGMALALVTFSQTAIAQVPSQPTPQQFQLEPKLKPGANSFMESQARELLEQQGYSNVSSLMNDQNGIWHGKAVKDQKTFDVSVDYQGKIAAK